MSSKNTQDRKPITASKALEIMRKFSEEIGIPFKEIKAPEKKKTASVRLL